MNDNSRHENYWMIQFKPLDGKCKKDRETLKKIIKALGGQE